MNKKIDRKESVNMVGDMAKNDEVNKRLRMASQSSIDKVCDILGSSEKGKTRAQVKSAKDLYGDNAITYKNKDSLFRKLVEAFINPFTIILIALAIVSTFTDVILAEPLEKDFTTMIIILTMVFISGILRFVQETRSGNAAEKLLEMIETTASIERFEEGTKEIPLDEIVVGDIVHLSAGDMIPADIRIIQAKDLFISQSSLTGESEPTEKFSAISNVEGSALEMENLAFMGTNVISGYAKGIVVLTGNDTIFGGVAQELGDANSNKL